MSGDDLLTALAERLREADVRWDDRPEPAGTYHEWLARAALAFVAERLPTRAEIVLTMDHVLSQRAGESMQHYDLRKADALLALLRERLGVKG